MVLDSKGNSNIALSAIILAGGHSTRMGQDKALLKVQGVPMLRLVYDTAQALCDLIYVVTPWQERYKHLLPVSCQFVQEVPLPGESMKDNTSKGKAALPLPHGPLVGFAQGLAQVQTDWVLLLACDLPRLRVEVLQVWIAELDSVGEEAIALLTHHAKGWDPLCGFYRRSCLSALTDFINQGGRSFQQWLAQHPVQVLSLPDSQMLFNCNTPSDLAAIQTLDTTL